MMAVARLAIATSATALRKARLLTEWLRRWALMNVLVSKTNTLPAVIQNFIELFFGQSALFHLGLKLIQKLRVFFC